MLRVPRLSPLLRPLRLSCSTMDKATLEPQILEDASSSAIEKGSPIALKLLPIFPENVQRYTRRRTTIRRFTDYPLPPFSRSFSRDRPPQWSPHRHPEGALYFAHEKHRVFTDCHLHDNALLAQITSALSQLFEKPGVQKMLNDKLDIVLDLTEETPENKECGYYFVDHSERIIFWADDFDMNMLKIWDFVPGVQTASHVQMGLEMQYWLHCQYFPAAYPFSLRVLQELRDIIIFSIGDAMTSLRATVPYPVEDLLRRLALTREMTDDLVSASGQPTLGNMNHGSIVVSARFMGEFALARFQHFHGEKTPRLNSDESVYGYKPKRSYFFILLSPLLFNAPLRYIRNVEVANTDQVINTASWHKLITALRSEWQDFVLYGTLILNTNVGFLAIPATVNSTPAQTASYASICFGLGSIISSTVLLRKYQSDTQDDIDTAGTFFKQHGLTTHGLEPLSIVLALPYALMVWGMATFISAFLITVFETNSIKVRGIMLATVFTVVLGLMGFVWTEKYFSWNQRTAQWWDKMKLAGSKMWDDSRSSKSAPEEKEQKLSV
ncbi:hypothetical protein K438DRAFT_1883364 [Mycena galopus ATCC 62051]|nr:hypothetical protein K438DRAFT_1883364 [Mycena galopus ATCC 62051]